MTVSEPQRLQLFDSARRSLGDDEASTLMTLLGHEGEPLASEPFVTRALDLAVEPLATKEYVGTTVDEAIDRAVKPLATKEYVRTTVDEAIDRAVKPLATKEYVADRVNRLFVTLLTVGTGLAALILAVARFG